MINILDINYSKIHSEIAKQINQGDSPKYCIMNEDTLRIIRDMSDVIGLPTEEEHEVVYGLIIATTPSLDFGEVDIR